jgi:hypothetical protein
MGGRNLRFINTLILILLLVLTLTGIYGLYFPFPSILFEIHRIAAWGLILLIPWKTIISIRSLERGVDRRLDRNVMIAISLLLAIVTLFLIVLSMIWKWNLSKYIWLGGYGYTAIGWHWGIALYLIPILLLHLWRRWPRPKKTDFTERRQVLKIIALSVASVATWSAAEVLAKSLQSTDSARRFTGSREEGSFAGNHYPVTSGRGQGKIKLEPETWKLHLTGAIQMPLTFTYEEVLALSKSKVTATLDCTGGWYTTQIWRGIYLTHLLNRAGLREQAAAIVLKGISDYAASFTLVQAQEILLATHVGGEGLDHVHGFPLRAVVPSRRGWHWVKWLTEIEVITISSSPVAGP